MELGSLAGSLGPEEGAPLLDFAAAVKSTSCPSSGFLMTTLLDFGGLTGTKVEEVAPNRAVEGGDETPAMLFDAVFFFFLRLFDVVWDGQ